MIVERLMTTTLSDSYAMGSINHINPFLSIPVWFRDFCHTFVNFMIGVSRGTQRLQLDYYSSLRGTLLSLLSAGMMVRISAPPFSCLTLTASCVLLHS